MSKIPKVPATFIVRPEYPICIYVYDSPVSKISPNTPIIVNAIPKKLLNTIILITFFKLQNINFKDSG